MTKIHVLGLLVMVGQIPVVATPATNIVEKDGRRQFWFYHNHKPMLAKESAYSEGEWRVEEPVRRQFSGKFRHQNRRRYA